MRKLIAHRGNINGANQEMENNPHYVQTALKAGYDVEVDVWYKDGQWMLGHDYPDWHIPTSFLDLKGIWFHCKNFDALRLLAQSPMINCFWHENDMFARTSHGYLWTTHWIPKGHMVITMCTNSDLPDSNHCKQVAGICSDYVGRLKR
jgi:hypothetical protein